MLRKWDPSVLRRQPAPPPQASPVSVLPPDIFGLGRPPWSESEMRDAMPEFLELYRRRPAMEDATGMLSPGAFALWFMLGRLAPKRVIFAGVDKGVSSWVAEQRLPHADLLCLTLDPARIRYRPSRARYVTGEFPSADPEALTGTAPGSSETLDPSAIAVVFEDHGDAPPRLERAHALGLKHLFFDANYPEYRGRRHLSVAACCNDRDAAGMPAHARERDWLAKNAETYSIFPHPFDYDQPVTLEQSLIRGKSLCGAFDAQRDAALRPFHEEMPSYRWTSYLKLK